MQCVTLSRSSVYASVEFGPCFILLLFFLIFLCSCVSSSSVSLPSSVLSFLPYIHSGFILVITFLCISPVPNVPFFPFSPSSFSPHPCQVTLLVIDCFHSLFFLYLIIYFSCTFLCLWCCSGFLCHKPHKPFPVQFVWQKFVIFLIVSI